MTITPGPLDYERHALRWILYRLMGKERNLEALCKQVPRIAIAAANIVRIEAALNTGKKSEETDALYKALKDFIAEATEQEGESEW